MEEILGMSNKEIERLKVLSDVIEGKITQVVASKKLKLSDRQARGMQAIEPTQFERALKDLDCSLILANTPQAKGRVERCNRTLQDRLIIAFLIVH